jgi:hypothetical protein
MHLAFALFADAANLSQEGKLNIMGVFDALHVEHLPALHPRAAFVVQLKGTSADVGSHQLTLQWLNPGGTELWSSDGQLTFGQPADEAAQVSFPLVIQLDLPLDAPGSYQMRVSLDQAVLGEVPVHVRGAIQVPTPPTPEWMS